MMNESPTESSMMTGVSLPPEQQLLIKFSWCCKQFRENTSDSAFKGDGKSLAWLIRSVREMMT